MSESLAAGSAECRADGLSALRSDELFDYACGKYLELESMVRRLSEAYGIPYGEVLHDVVSGFDDVSPEV